jgi:hypothetical protein
LLFTLSQNFHTFNCRSEYDSVFKIPLKRNYFLVVGALAALWRLAIARTDQYRER